MFSDAAKRQIDSIPGIGMPMSLHSQGEETRALARVSRPGAMTAILRVRAPGVTFEMATGDFGYGQIRNYGR